MFAIIAMHTSVIFWYLGRPVPRLTQAITTPLKFGTIAFFLISGFLLGERLETCKPLDYLGRRINKVFLPWSIWFVAMCLFSTLANLWHLHVNPIFSLQAVPVLLHEAVQTLFTSAFWFVPNLLLALSILLLFRSWLRDMRFGAVLLAFNLFYVVNIYARWVPSGHSQAFLGFVFHLWLGAYVSVHFSRLNHWVATVPTSLLSGLTLLAGLLAFGEARLLAHLHSNDPMNTLRLTNQIFSVAVVLLLLKLPRLTSPSFVHVRRHTFGLYLSHTIILRFVLIVAVREIRPSWRSSFLFSHLGLVGLWVVATAITYSISLLLVKAIDTIPSLQWTIGSESRRPQRAPAGRSGSALSLERPLAPAGKLSTRASQVSA